LFEKKTTKEGKTSEYKINTQKPIMNGWEKVRKVIPFTIASKKLNT
jgi:hypothetical protein